MRETQYFERENDTPPLARPTEFPGHFTILPEQNGKAHKPMPEYSTISPEQNGKGHIPDEPDPDPSFSDSPSKKKKQDENKKRCKHKKDDFQTHHQATILIRLTIVITDTNDIRGRAIRKISDQIMRTFNGNVADDSI